VTETNATHKLLAAIADERPHPTPDEVRAIVASANWSDDGWKSDWRSQVPFALWAVWPDLSEESRLVAYLIALASDERLDHLR
jgi:hypothetical protein